MQLITFSETRQWIKTSENPLAKFIFSTIKKIINFDLPIPKFILRFLYWTYKTLNSFYATITRIFFYTPVLKGRLASVGNNLNLYGGVPYISGPVQIHVGSNCRISGATNITGRVASI